MSVLVPPPLHSKRPMRRPPGAAQAEGSAVDLKPPKRLREGGRPPSSFRHYFFPAPQSEREEGRAANPPTIPFLISHSSSPKRASFNARPGEPPPSPPTPPAANFHKLRPTNRILETPPKPRRPTSADLRGVVDVVLPVNVAIVDPVDGEDDVIV